MATKTPKPDTKYYEVVEKKNSGFVMDGTKGTVYQQELTAPAVRWIPTKGKMAVEGDKKGTKVYKEIQYLSGANTIDIEEQKRLGLVSRPFEDKIPMENGFMTVVRDGNTIALYDYLEKSFYNEDNPDRPTSATAIYREVKLDKKAESILDEDVLLTQAKSLVYELRLSTGNSTTPYKYNQDRINAMCTLLNVWDESPERQLILLLNKATQDPRNFLEVVVKAEKTVITEVAHALELNIVQFDKNVAFFVTPDGNKVIYEVDADPKAKIDFKMELLGAFLSTEEGNGALTELRTKLEIAKDK